MPASHLKEAQDRFVAVWGQMGSAWGISRTMAEVHALLFITLCTDDIMERLQISRGNASMSMRALLDWGIVERVHRRGDRKEYFKAEGDVWAMFRAIVRERMKREVDPLRAQLYEIRDQTGERAGRDPSADLLAHNKRLDELLRFFQTLEGVSNSFVSPAGKGLQAAAKILGYIGATGGATNSAPGREQSGTKEAG